jgi:NRAMP (natural resistance-associated macrophage protein)-like metal ion transporter
VPEADWRNVTCGSRTDLAELLGSAIALNLLFPRMPLWAGVLLTSADVLLVLAFFQGNPTTRRGMLGFELIIVGLVFAVFACFAVLVIKVGPDWGEAFFGYVPSKEVFGPGCVLCAQSARFRTRLTLQPTLRSSALYTSVGIIGAVRGVPCC